MGLIYMESRKGQDLLSKLRAWRSQDRVKAKGGGRERSEEKYIAQ